VPRASVVPPGVGAEPQARAEPEAPDYIERNRRIWDALARQEIARARRAWQSEELLWGRWSTPESELGLLVDVAPESEAIELGCGSAEVSSWLRRLGMHPVAVDISTGQLSVAETLQRESGLEFPLILATAEDVPRASESFDLVISEYGASLWCPPSRWLREARRLVRPGGKLVFFTPSPFLTACTPGDGGPPGTQLERSYFSSGAVDYGVEGGVEFHATNAEWMRLLRHAGFGVEALVETRPDERHAARYDLVSSTWASRWPSEEIWVARAVRPPSEPFL
jgi:ubiquinone/menaquinone biosynthesis C-methylase UbiE